MVPNLELARTVGRARAGGGRQLLQQIGKAVAQLQKFAVGKIPSFAILAEPLQGKLLAASLVGWLPC